MKIEILDKNKSTIKIMAYSINKDKEGLIELMKKNGVAVENDISKGKLRVLLLKLLKESKTFREEYKNWVLEKSGQKKAVESEIAKQAIASQGNNKSNTEEFGNLNWKNVTGNNFDPLGLLGTTPTGISGTTSTSTTDTTSTTDPKKGFWDVSLSELLQFGTVGLNTLSTSMQTNADVAVVNASVEKERLEQEKGNSLDPTPVKTKVTYIIVGLLAVGAIGFGIYYMNKKK